MQTCTFDINQCTEWRTSKYLGTRAWINHSSNERLNKRFP